MVELLEKELSYKIHGCMINVSKKYGKGLKELIYQKALAEEQTMAGINFEQQKRINVYSFDTGKILGCYVPDFIVEKKIIIEIKATNFTIKLGLEQLWSYLKVSEYEIAYLVNFSTDKLFIKRAIYTNDRKPFIKKFSVN